MDAGVLTQPGPTTIGGDIRTVAILTTGLSPAACYLARRLQGSGCRIYLVNQRHLPVAWNSWKFFWRLLKKRGVRCCLDNVLLYYVNYISALPGRCWRKLRRTLRAIGGAGPKSGGGAPRYPITPGIPAPPDDISTLPPALRPDPGICREPWLTYVEVNDMNRKPDQDLLRALEPDLILLGGAPVLFGSTIKLAKVACLNAHCGITPRYAGNSPAVWALYERRFEDVGFTVHQVVPTVDAGAVLWQERVRWDPAQPLSVLWPVLINQMVEKLGDIAVALMARQSFQAFPQGKVRVLPPAGYFAKKLADYRRRAYAKRLAALDGPDQAKPPEACGDPRVRQEDGVPL